MKKLIATSSIALSLVFGFALANAEEPSMSDPNAKTQDQMAGSVAKSTATHCVDKAGVSYNKSDKGFEKCMTDNAARMEKEQSGKVEQSIDKTTDQAKDEANKAKQDMDKSLSGATTPPSGSNP